jgi:hypothetical protein
LRFRIFTCACLLILAAYFVAVGQPLSSSESNHSASLSDLQDKQKALLVVFKSRVISAEDRDRAIIEDVLKANPQPTGRYRWVYNEMAKKLNQYIRKYGSVRSAEDLTDAEYVIFFNVVEFRRILNAIYPYGELFVIVKGSPQDLKPPRIVWRAKKVMFSSDALNALIKDLKTLRGES